MEKKDYKTLNKIIKDILHNLKDLNRNLVSDGFEESLNYLSKYIDIKVHRYKTGSECWTWNVPQKWRIKDGYIKHNGNVMVSFNDCPLHVMSYSTPISAIMTGQELLTHIYIHKKIPEAIPYEFSFYVPKWGFCLTHEQRNKIKSDEMYEVFIDSEFSDDYLSVGEYTVRGTSEEYIFFLSHLDHPCQVNDGLIGCVVNTALATLLKNRKPYYNYTFLFVPESIGSIAFLSQNEQLISKIKYSVFNEMVGLDNPLVLQKSYKGEELVNNYVLYAMRQIQGSAKAYPYLTIAGNDEKIFNAPGVSIPSISILRIDQDRRLKEKDRARREGRDENIPLYKEYHSHLDNIETVDYERVEKTIETLYSLCDIFEKDYIPVRKFQGPVFLSKYDLWVDWRTNLKMSENIMWITYCLEGDMTAFQIAEKLKLDFEDVVDLLNRFHDKGLIEQKKIPIGFDR